MVVTWLGIFLARVCSISHTNPLACLVNSLDTLQGCLNWLSMRSITLLGPLSEKLNTFFSFILMEGLKGAATACRSSPWLTSASYSSSSVCSWPQWWPFVRMSIRAFLGGVMLHEISSRPVASWGYLLPSHRLAYIRRRLLYLLESANGRLSF